MEEPPGPTTAPPTPAGGFLMGSSPPNAPRSNTPVQSLGSSDSSRKKHSRQGANAANRREDLELRGTPRSKRFQNLFQNQPQEPTIKEVVLKLHALAETTLIMPPKGGEVMNSVSLESVADIKTLIAKLVDLTNLNHTKRVTRPNPFLFESNQSTSINAKLDALTALMQQSQQSNTHTHSPARTGTAGPAQSTYALMASKHTPKAPDTTSTPTVGRTKPPTTKKQAVRRTINMITLSQTTKGGMAMSNHTTTAVTTHINLLLAVKKITISHESTDPIRVIAMHQYPSNELGIYTGTAAEAEVLRAKAQEWLPVFSKELTVKPDFFPIVVHRISTSFNPQNPDHLSDLAAANYPMLQDVASMKWLNQKAVEGGKAFSSILITLKDRAIAKSAVKNSI